MNKQQTQAFLANLHQQEKSHQPSNYSKCYKEMPIAWVERIFQRLMETLGTQKLNKFSENQDLNKIMAVWSEELADLTPDEIKRGLKHVSGENVVFWPSVGEFKNWCRPKKEETIYSRVPTYEETLARFANERGLKQEPDYELGNNVLSSLKAMLNG